MKFGLGASVVDLDRSEVRRGEEVVALTSNEAALLGYLARHAGTNCTRDALLADVWGYRQGLQTRAVDFAVHRLRRKIEPDPTSPVHLVSAPGRGYRLAAPLPSSALPGHGLVGRDALVAALAAWRSGPPAVLALVGPGGVGKTRLARLLGGIFVDLTAATRDDGVARLVASTLGVPVPAVWRAARAVPLLVLDDAEHVASGVDAFLAEAGAPPPCHVLVTTRITPERTAAWEVPPLLRPDSVALLRARAPAPLADGDEALGALAEALGHLPLALEHAAARLGVIGVDALRRRVEAGAIGLVSGRATLVPRHASLDALLAWSWTLSSATERRVLVRALAFAASFDFDGVEALTGLDPVQSGDRRVEGLARGQLGNLAAYVGAHDLAEERYAAAVAVLDEVGLASDDGAVFLGNLGTVRLQRGDLAGAEATLTEALARMGATRYAVNRGRLHTNLGNLYAQRGNGPLTDHHYGRAEALFREAGDRMCLGQLLGNVALRRLDLGALDEAAALAEEALRLHRSLGNTRSEGFVWLTLGDLALERGRADALDALVRARAAFDEVADRRTGGWAAWMLGRARALLGAAGAAEALREGVATLREVGDGEGLARATATLALLEPVERPEVSDEIGAALWAVVDGAVPDPALLARSHDLRLQARLAARAT